MIKYENANNILNDIIKKLNNSKDIDYLIFITMNEIHPNCINIIDYEAACKLFECIEEKTHIEFYKSFAAQIIKKFMTRGDKYMNSMEHYYDVHMLEEACRYKIKFVKLSQKTSQIKNRRKTK